MAEITLENIDLVRERAGVSYREAKEALERNDGNVIDTLIELETEEKASAWTEWTEEVSVRSSDVLNKVKEVVQQGNVTKIRVKHNDQVLVEIPVTLGTLGVIILPHMTVLSVIVAAFTKCTIEVVRRSEKAEGEEETIYQANMNFNPFKKCKKEETVAEPEKEEADEPDKEEKGKAKK